MYSARFKNQGKESNSIKYGTFLLTTLKNISSIARGDWALAYLRYTDHSHYDVEINPVVKVANQKKPRQLLWEVWNQMLADATGEVKKVLDTAAYDMV